ncbi:conserved hypothetical protein [Rhodopseudomonas palustris HaA2]|uniref:DUF2059 domain-containing protein n=1 Tax=Rhodopseudomonas palustris (strain HaA2) TaxID=316058 RepID=Q2IUM9_RHOP2|nr:DUF2059 domain-containing protein [Rhodopseudomonas palustris]ABD08081.1 conserved hypothetical protein [Rhodopseudomonas palustris HaA2]
MKYLSKALPAVVLALGLALSVGHAQAQTKPPSPAAIAAAKEILELKRANTIYANAVPNIVQRTMDTLMQTNLNYQQDLKEVAMVVAKTMAGREKEIGDGMAKIYAQDFTEQELKDLVVFYKTPLGQKLLNEEPKAIQQSMAYMNQWAQTFAEEVNGQFRAEMRKRGKAI